MSRDLRHRVRYFSEPITLQVAKEIVEDGIPGVELDGIEYNMFGQIMETDDDVKLNHLAEGQSNYIRIRLPKPSTFEVVKNKCIITVQSKYFLVSEIRSYEYNTSEIVCIAREINNPSDWRS